MCRSVSEDKVFYERAFDAEVKGRLYARFHIDADGVPEFETDDDCRNYIVNLYLLSANATEIFDVTYEIDDTTDLVPIGHSTRRANDFCVSITSSRDVPIHVGVKIGNAVYKQRAWLSNMLENGYARKSNSAIRYAINLIKYS